MPTHIRLAAGELKNIKFNGLKALDIKVLKHFKIINNNYSNLYNIILYYICIIISSMI